MTTAWSFSRYDLHRKCPRWFKYRHLDKRAEPPSTPMMRGAARHKLLENFVKMKGRVKFPVEHQDLQLVVPELKKILKCRPLTERQQAFTVDWRPCEWFGPHTSCRVVVDLSYWQGAEDLIVLDYKTGKIKPEEHEEQLTVYALEKLITAPAAKAITTGVWYVDHEATPRLLAVYDGDLGAHRKRLIRTWDRATRALRADNKFKPTPSPSACRFCPHGVSKGGPCEAEAT